MKITHCGRGCHFARASCLCTLSPPLPICIFYSCRPTPTLLVIFCSICAQDNKKNYFHFISTSNTFSIMQKERETNPFIGTRAHSDPIQAAAFRIICRLCLCLRHSLCLRLCRRLCLWPCPARRARTRPDFPATT